MKGDLKGKKVKMVWYIGSKMGWGRRKDIWRDGELDGLIEGSPAPNPVSIAKRQVREVSE